MCQNKLFSLSLSLSLSLYKKICGYEADRCHAYLKKIFTYMYLFKLFHCYFELNTGVAVGFVGYIMAAVSDGGGHGMKVT